MDNAKSGNARLIDNLMRVEMSRMDKYGDNIFSDRLTIITQSAPYRRFVEFNEPFRLQEHCISFVCKGTRTLSVSHRDYHLKEGDLLLVPAGSILVNRKLSDDIEVYSVVFRISMAAGERLVGSDVVSLHLSNANQRLVDDYIHLMDRMAHNGIADSDSMDYLLLSLLYLIKEWDREQNVAARSEWHSRSTDLYMRFVRLIGSDVIPRRDPSFYADQLNVTKGYLSQIVKKHSGRTMMDWINEKTLVEAKLLLAHTEKLLDEIAADLFLRSSSQLVKFFKWQTGETPIAYRKRMQGKI